VLQLNCTKIDQQFTKPLFSRREAVYIKQLWTLLNYSMYLLLQHCRWHPIQHNNTELLIQPDIEHNCDWLSKYYSIYSAHIYCSKHNSEVVFKKVTVLISFLEVNCFCFYCRAGKKLPFLLCLGIEDPLIPDLEKEESSPAEHLSMYKLQHVD